MAYFWHVDAPSADADDLADLGVEQGFATQSEAEAWLAGNYADLDAVGVNAVTLLEEDRVVYGPMSLSAG